MKTTNIPFFIVIFLLSAVTAIWLIAHLIEVYPITDQFNMSDPDSMLFARITEQSILKGKILKTDNYGSAPYEIEHGLPPFYMFFLYAVANGFFILFPKSTLDPMWVVGMLPILFTWLTALIITLSIWFLTKNKALTLFCSLALLPGVSASLVSSFLALDYDFLISFFIWAWILNLAFLINQDHFKPSNSKLKVHLLVGTLVSIFFHATWAGLPMFFFIVTLFGFILWLTNHSIAPTHNYYAIRTMLVGGLCNLIYIYLNEPTAQLISINKYSYFQPLTSIAASLFLHTLHCRPLNKIKFNKTKKLLGFLILFVSIVILSLLFKPQIVQGLGFLFKKDPIHATISELRPLFTFKNNVFVPFKFLTDMFGSFGFLAFLLPVFVFLPAKGFKSTTGFFLKLWLFTMILLIVFQIRYIRWPGIGLNLYVGMILYNLWVFLRGSLSADLYKIPRLIGIFLFFMVLYLSLNFQAIYVVHRLNNNFMEALSWIKRYTPPTSGYFDDLEPEYSILSYWDKGNAINYYAHRPTSSNNAMWGYKTLADVFSSLTESEAYALCEKYKIKYILTNPSRGHSRIIYDYWPTFINMPEAPVYKLSFSPLEPVTNHKNYFFFWLIDNLALTSKAAFEPTSHFRLVYVGNTQKNTVLFPYTLFERVKGAHINLSIPPNTPLELSIIIKLDGKEFLYKKKTISNDHGLASVTVPYSNSYLKGRVKTDLLYKISYEENEKNIKAFAVVTEEDVQNGNHVMAELL